MTYSQAEERTRLRRALADQAVQLAVQNRWAEAVEVNRTILDAFPTDVDANNRLGKALLELGRYAEAREAYRAALTADPSNAIARRNLARLEHLEDAAVEGTSAPAGERIDLALFVEETGRTGYTTLVEPGDLAVLARLTAGDRVDLRVQGGQLAVHAPDGTYLGLVEPRLGLRLAAMMEAGNRYIAAVQSATDGTVRVVIREVYQDPSQAGKLSFPAKTGDEFRGYTRESLVNRWEGDAEDDEDDEDEYGPDWEERKPLTPDEMDDYPEDDAEDMKDDDI